MINALLVALAIAAPGTPAQRITPRTLPIPQYTQWRPSGCRTVPFTHPVLLPRTAFHRAHGDLESSDEVELAYAPVFARQWIAESSLYQVTTPAFDSAGNLYMTPVLPHEPILMISLSPDTGERRFVLPLGQGQRGGGAVPVVLRDPETQGEVVYMHSYSRLTAARTDGSIVWDVPTGLGPATGAQQTPIGLAWVPNADALVGQTRDGYVFLIDRRSGAPLLPAPLQLPGEPTPPVASTVPPSIAALVDELLQPLVAFPTGSGVIGLIEVLLGGSSEVANNLSVDPRTNRLWIAASSRDGEDGTVDGVSELGALYRYDVVNQDGAWTLAEVCHHNFPGGSASTPTLGRNGSRIYLGDNGGALIAINADDCSEAWSVDVGAQIFGSVAAASDGREIFAASADGIYQVVDEGDHGRRGWTAVLDVYDVPPALPQYNGMNLLLAGVGANGLLIHVGVGVTGAQRLPVRTGIVHVDRLTGAPRWFADGLEESLGAMSTGPDGALYLSHAPLRRAFSRVLGFTDEAPIGGVSKWAATRNDLLARDAACAAADRAANAFAQRSACPDSMLADLSQVDALRGQMLDAAELAVASGDLDAAIDTQLRWMAERVGAPPRATSSHYDRRAARYHQRAALGLRRACRLLSTPGG